jgi:peptidoglycan/xylan/chitin deacetylase (PgdA/CDA1 family)
MGAPIETPLTMFTRFPAGATPPISGAPPLPTLAIVPARYPALDKIPPTDSEEVKEWLKELDGINIPTFGPTADGSCIGDPAAAADASRCWWTCGGCTRATDVTVCPEKDTWGVSFDDGPSPYTPKLLNYLNEKDIKSTFFVVGSRVISRPEILQTEFMIGHEISVHTWSHHPLTAMTNEQIVAELGWTRKAIKEVLGVTPVTMRPPYGDIDDRVRAIALAMGMTPVIWTRAGNIAFDTKDWRIAGGTENGTSSYAAWQQILTNSQKIDTGFISLQHDLYQQSVDMAVGYILPDALSHSPAFTLKPIIECLNQDAGNAYLETNPTLSADIAAATGTSTPNIAQGSTGRSATASGAMSTQVGVVATLVAGIFAATLSMML